MSIDLNVYDRLLLRKLTMKSILNFGANAHLSVSELIKINKHGELVWSYYNLSKISYTDEVLDTLGITKEERIAKPGTDPELYKIVIKRFDAQSLEKKLQHNKQRFIDRFTSTKVITRLNKQVMPLEETIQENVS